MPVPAKRCTAAETEPSPPAMITGRFAAAASSSARPSPSGATRAISASRPAERKAWHTREATSSPANWAAVPAEALTRTMGFIGRERLRLGGDLRHNSRMAAAFLPEMRGISLAHAAKKMLQNPPEPFSGRARSLGNPATWSSPHSPCALAGYLKRLGSSGPLFSCAEDPDRVVLRRGPPEKKEAPEPEPLVLIWLRGG